MTRRSSEAKKERRSWTNFLLQHGPGVRPPVQRRAPRQLEGSIDLASGITEIVVRYATSLTKDESLFVRLATASTLTAPLATPEVKRVLVRANPTVPLARRLGWRLPGARARVESARLPSASPQATCTDEWTSG